MEIDWKHETILVWNVSVVKANFFGQFQTTFIYTNGRWFYLGLQKNLYWMRMVMVNMTTPWMDMAQMFFPTIFQLSGSLKRSSPKRGKTMVLNKVNTQEKS